MNQQGNDLPILYKNNLQLAWGSATTLTVASGQARASGNNADMALVSGVTINTAVNGVNGLDTGSLQASSCYAIYEISSSLNIKQTAMILSPALTGGPTVPPTDYDIYTHVGYWLTDSSANLIKGYVVGNGNQRQHYHDAAIPVLTAGAATALTAISLAAAVPPVDNIPVLLTGSFTPATAGDKSSLAIGGSAATVLPFISGTVATKADTSNLKILSKLVTALPTVAYINSAASGALSVWVYGFEYFV